MAAESASPPPSPPSPTPSPGGAGEILVPISVGELIDKITILSIKARRIEAADRRANVVRELDALQAVLAAAGLAEHPPLAEPTTELTAVNDQLWDIEDRIRDCERRGDFGADFIALARAVYRTNDRRAELKRAINDLSGSALVEEKSYRPY